jgi:hypothetical protein
MLISTMTVGELKDALDDYADDTLVMLAHDYGDHCHTTAVECIAEVEEAEVEHRGAYGTYNIVDDDDDDDHYDDEDDRAAIEAEKAARAKKRKRVLVLFDATARDRF